MRKRILVILICCFTLSGIISGCNQNQQESKEKHQKKFSNIKDIEVKDEMIQLEDNLEVIQYKGDDGFDEFLNRGGAKSDEDVAQYLTDRLSDSGVKIFFGGSPFGCSTISVANSDGGYFFGRNFDWENCKALIVSAKPDNGYASVSTVNMDFIQAGGLDISKFPEKIQAIVGLYAPLDGMNEKGLSVAVNMIQDSDTINQNTDKPDVTTTTIVRLLLNKATTVSEAVELLKKYDLHASMGMMVHFAIADAKGSSVVVEYIGNKMSVVETPVVTNFYLTKGDKYGIGTKQSHERYEILLDTLNQKNSMTQADVKDVLNRVSKHNFGEFESTEWSIVMNQQTKELIYFHRENYEQGYRILVN